MLVIDTYPTITLVDDQNKITQATFMLLTGKNINLQKRIGKRINVVRERGHIYIEDREPIEGEIYSIGGKNFICKYVDEKGIGLLSAVDNSMALLNLEGPLRIK